jgi:hypothetical protein
MTRMRSQSPAPHAPTPSHFGSLGIWGKVTHLAQYCQEQTTDG